ncbi:MAG: sigma-70 family RNA polymerase sigma factor [Planctomycetales bacterium]|nr:sigma-70 family RNA polymerase sigma factor [Planctomycetales bacterium]
MALDGPTFATTQWTLVWQAAKDQDDTARPALEEIIRRYWEPLYTFARRRGMSREDAEDATQEFLEGIVRGELLNAADPAKGKFRAYLLTAWRRFLIDQYRKETALARGGRERILSLDFGRGEKRWLDVEASAPDADRIFSLIWANNLLDEVRRRLHKIYADRDRNHVYETLLPLLTVPMDAARYESLATELTLSCSAVKVALHRLRQRFGETLRDVVLETLDDPEEIDAEIGELLAIMAGK